MKTSAGGSLQVDNIKKSFGAACVLSGVTFSVSPGERHGLIGVNGAGKTTLFNIIAGDLAPGSGQIKMDGTDITGHSIQERALLGLGRTYQVSSLVMSETVRANLILSLGNGRLPSAWQLWDNVNSANKVMAVAERMGMMNMLDMPVHDLSHGAQRQLELAMVLHRNPKVLLLDEPAAGLSPAERETLTQAIRKLPGSVTMIMVEHDLEIILNLCERLTVLHHGETLMTGAPEDVVANKTVRDIYLGNT